MCDSVEIEEFIYEHDVLVVFGKIFLICSIIVGLFCGIMDYKHGLDVRCKINKVDTKEVSVSIKSITSKDNQLIGDIEIEGKDFKIYLWEYVGYDLITEENGGSSIQVGDIVKVNYTKYEKTKTVFPSLKEESYIDIIPEYYYDEHKANGNYIFSEVGWLIIHATKVVSIIVFFGCSIALVWYYSVLGGLKHKHRKTCVSSKER